MARLRWHWAGLSSRCDHSSLIRHRFGSVSAAWHPAGASCLLGGSGSFEPPGLTTAPSSTATFFLAPPGEAEFSGRAAPDLPHSSGTARHFEKLLPPQNRLPALFPLLAVLRTIRLPQFGHEQLASPLPASRARTTCSGADSVAGCLAGVIPGKPASRNYRPSASASA